MSRCGRCKESPITHYDTGWCDDCAKHDEIAWPTEVSVRPGTLGWALWWALEAKEVAGNEDAMAARVAWWRVTRGSCPHGSDLRNAVDHMLHCCGGFDAEDLGL